MAASSSSNAPAPKPQVLSYAESARRAGSAAASQASRARFPVQNGIVRVASESLSSGSSGGNVAQGPSVPPRPTTPPQPTQSVPDEARQQKSSDVPSPKPPAKPAPPPNVWTARKEQMAQRVAAAQQQPVLPQAHVNSVQISENIASLASHTNTADKPAGMATRHPPPPNGITNQTSHEDLSSSASSKSVDDPFIVRIPPHGHAGTRLASQTPPSLDDVESWPEMGKPGPSTSTSVSGSGSPAMGSFISEGDKKEGTSGSHKKSEKTKWVQIPPSELQAAADEQTARSRTQSQQRRGKDGKSRSRHHSQSRNPSRQSQSQSHLSTNAAASSGGSSNGRQAEAHTGSRSSEASAVHSRAESSTHSRSTSIHSSPRYPGRGRRLPDDRGSAAGYSAHPPPFVVDPNAGPSNIAKKLAAEGFSNSNMDELPTDLPATENSRPTQVDFQGQGYPDATYSSMNQGQPQMHTAYTSHSPVYYAPLPPNATTYDGANSVYGSVPPNMAYPAPLQPQQPGQANPGNHAHGYPGFAGYVPPHIPSNQNPYPYIYAPYAYYPPQAPGQAHDRQPLSPVFDNANIMQNQTTFDPNVGIVQLAQGMRSIHLSPNLPPTSSRTRPPPPGKSAALSGYRDIVPVPVSPLLSASNRQSIVTDTTSGIKAEAPVEDKDTPPVQSAQSRKEEMVFGSIRPGGVKSPSPAPASSAQSFASASTSPNEMSPKSPRTLTAFSVGFGGAPTIRIKARNRRQGDRKKGSVTSPDLAEPTPVAESPVMGQAEESSPVASKDGDVISVRDDEENDSVKGGVVVKVIDLTDRETRWEFGTSFHPDTEGTINAKDQNQEVQPREPQEESDQQQSIQDLQPHQSQPHMAQALQYSVPLPQQLAYGIVSHMHIPIAIPIPPGASPQGSIQPLPQHLPALGPLNVGPGFVSPLNLSSPGPGISGPSSGGGDEFEVRDFGFGFGPSSGSGIMPERLREERIERERERERDRDQRDVYRDREYNNYGQGRARRNSNANGFSGYGGYEGRGAYGGRRGRGVNGFGRGYSRGGGYSGRGNHGNYQQRHQHQPSLNVSTGPFPVQHVGLPTAQVQHSPQQSQNQNQIPSDLPNGYYQSQQNAAQYITSPYAQYNPPIPQPIPQPQHPMPLPVTSLSFPLDPIRVYLLGQVEYYFSNQNLASDIYLRKQMDSRGWLPIQVIASFNRVKQLTGDVQMVKDVLELSSLVEVRDDHVRLSDSQWTKFVLPGAPTSTIEVVEDADEDEEDDVVFVLGGEENQSWTPDRGQLNQAVAQEAPEN